MIWPIKNLVSYKVMRISDKKPYISQGFGENPQIYAQFGHDGHNGLDIAAIKKTPIYASHDGEVKYFIEKSGYGNYAKVVNSGFETVYGHMNSFEGKNRSVKQGDVIGYVGTSGFSTGDHLHFGIRLRKDGRIINQTNGYGGSVDPFKYLSMNQTKIVLSKDGKTVYIATPVAMDFENFKKQASVEGIDLPDPIPPSSSL